mmetsp:Transcript_3934/g.8907  ORF Transcript_3934/g.8907 Transcript_3934/m.8907 type:complete len:96 (+) Transcript_3934:747-1034(+)
MMAEPAFMSRRQKTSPFLDTRKSLDETDGRIKRLPGPERNLNRHHWKVQQMEKAAGVERTPPVATSRQQMAKTKLSATLHRRHRTRVPCILSPVL